MDWTLARTFVAVAEGGSLSAAASRLGLTQPTVSRQVQLLEAELGAPLFVRHGRGVRLTARGEELLEVARPIEEAIVAFERVASGTRQEPRGAVRVAASEIVGVEVLVPELASLRAAHPKVTVELVLDNLPSDLLAGAADIAVRLFQPTQLDLVARKIGEVGVGLYASRSYVAARGAPRSLEALAEHDLIGFDPRGPLGRAMERAVPSARLATLALGTDSLTAHLAAARAGVGLAPLQRPIAARHPELEDVSPPGFQVTLPIWLASHRDVGRGGHVRAVHEWLIEILSRYVE